MTKPAGNLPTWNTGLANNTEPNGAKKTLGWEVNEKPASSYFNWWQNKVGEWVSYLNGLAAEAFTWTGLHAFDRNVNIEPNGAAGAATNEVGLTVIGRGDRPGISVAPGASTPHAMHTAGTIQFVEDAPASKTDTLWNELSHRNIVKAHAYITTDGAGAVTYEDGANVTSVSLPGANAVRVTFAQDMSDTKYTVVASGSDAFNARPMGPRVITRATTHCDIVFESVSAGTFLPATWSGEINIVVIGVQ